MIIDSSIDKGYWEFYQYNISVWLLFVSWYLHLLVYDVALSDMTQAIVE